MNRRSFFRRTLAACAGVALFPFIPKPIPGQPVPPFIKVFGKAVINPEWKTATYEFAIIGYPKDPWPFRFRDEQSAMAWMNNQVELYKRS